MYLARRRVSVKRSRSATESVCECDRCLEKDSVCIETRPLQTSANFVLLVTTRIYGNKRDQHE